LVRVSPESARNAKPKIKFVTHGGASALRGRSAIDLRTSLGRKYKAGLIELKSHLGNELTPPQVRLVDMATRLGLLSDLAWGELMREGDLIKDGAAHPAIDVFLKSSKHQKEVLALLGLERKVRNVTLQDILEGRATRETA
jgi:hypothetical protein